MRYVLCFFPWIGAVIGAALYGWDALCRLCQIGSLGRTAFGVAIPLLITGGFHADGFLDTVDAFSSYQPKERKLEILKDSHIGAFAVIRFGLYLLLFLAGLSEVRKPALLKILCAGFFLSRCLCGISVVAFPMARKEGMLHYAAHSAHRKAVLSVLSLQGIACIAYMASCALGAGILAAAAACLALAYYGCRTKKALGGITGDTAGYFVLLCELCILVAVAAVDIAGR